MFDIGEEEEKGCYQAAKSNLLNVDDDGFLVPCLS